MVAGIPPIRLSEEQRKRLHRAGLSARQITALEETALPLGKLFLRPPLRMADVRDELTKMRRQFLGPLIHRLDKPSEFRAGRTSLHDMFNTRMTRAREQALLLVCDVTAREYGFQVVEDRRIPADKLARVFDLVALLSGR